LIYQIKNQAADGDRRKAFGAFHFSFAIESFTKLYISQTSLAFDISFDWKGHAFFPFW
jgi:hypothetical protein